jgi:site-specific recombinase XerD
MDALEKIMSDYKRHGSKSNRKEQVEKIRNFLEFNGLVHPKQIKNAHVIKFYKHLRAKNRSERTIYYYFLALKQLFSLLGRSEPPKPLITPLQNQKNRNQTENF